MGLRRENYAACDGEGARACGGESSLPCWAGRGWVGVGRGALLRLHQLLRLTLKILQVQVREGTKVGVDGTA